MVLPCIAASAADFEDTRQRFRIPVVEPWRFAPSFGDVYGTAFERRFGKQRRGRLLVHVDSVEAAHVQDFRKKIEAQHDEALGYALVKRSQQTLPYAVATVRDYAVRTSDGHSVKVRAWYFRALGRYYHLRLSARARDFQKALRSVRPMISGFAPQQKRIRRRSERARYPAALLGPWHGKQVKLHFSEDGRFEMGPVAGTFKVEGQVLILAPESGEKLSFIFELVGPELRLLSKRLSEPAIYTRDAPAKKRAAVAPGLVGRWRTTSDSGPLTLELKKDGAFGMGTMSGTWRATSGLLILESPDGELIRYQYKRRGNKLVLSAGDLDSKLRFEKNPDR